ncbi:phenolic acid decarboxylase [Nocardia sp. NPDC050175]|uniref:phenolic acid decarboxylase n=1 Tax=Nocardia sp. NPDC050175 TaxID=3364317 RepID=UPI003795E9C2
MTTTGARARLERDVSGIVGKQFIYTYDALGWRYELYVRAETVVDYRVHVGKMGGRWVTGQAIDLARLDTDTYKISWIGPTGSALSLTVMPARRILHGVIFGPRWAEDDPEPMIGYQNERLAQIVAARDQGPTYPIHMFGGFATITYLADRGPGDITVIACAPEDLPEGYATRTN